MRHLPDTMVTSGLRTGARCREAVCKAPIDFRLNVHAKPKARWMPFNAGAVPLHTETDERGVKYQLMAKSDLHFTTCRAKRPAAGARA